MKNQNETSTASATTKDLNSDQELSEKELESAAGGTIPFPPTQIPKDDSILSISPSSTLLQTKI